MCELHARIPFRREMRNCNVICLTVTWLSEDSPDYASIPVSKKVQSCGDNSRLNSTASRYRSRTKRTTHNSQKTDIQTLLSSSLETSSASLKKVLCKYFQHIDVNTRGGRILHHCYSPFHYALKPLLCTQLGKLNHSSILLLTANRQKLKQSQATVKTVPF